MEYGPLNWLSQRPQYLRDILIRLTFATVQGSAKLRENLKPNEKPVEVQEKVQDNIRQVKTVAGKKH